MENYVNHTLYATVWGKHIPANYLAANKINGMYLLIILF